MNAAPHSARKILALRYRSIGDIILSNPALAGLRRTFPQAQIHMLVDDVFAEILNGNPNVDRVITSPRKPEGPQWKADLEMVKTLRAENYDITVDLHGGPRSSWFSLLSGAKIRAGHPFRWRNRVCYNVNAKTPAADDHTWKVQFLVAEALGAKWPDEPEFILAVSDESRRTMAEKMSKEGFTFDRPLILLHPGARIDVKRWPADRMGELARWLVDKKGVAVALAGSAADTEEIKRIRGASGYAIPFFTGLSLGELAALIERSAAIVCNDSGPMHMAGALHIPTVALFGPSDPHVWEPVGCRKIIITPPPMDCMPCGQKGCPKEGNHCMTRIGVNEVKTAVERLGVLNGGVGR
ncbi:MAG: lipopolysaccharide heptosyltransferase II [Nitrospinae bacterium]|nr:lipopolysaccharide heptosyltransferase II [Nitrospinota bacterium]